MILDIDVDVGKCRRKAGSSCLVNRIWPTYKWDIFGLYPTDPNLLQPSWDIQVPVINGVMGPQ